MAAYISLFYFKGRCLGGFSIVFYDINLFVNRLIHYLISSPLFFMDSNPISRKSKNCNLQEPYVKNSQAQKSLWATPREGVQGLDQTRAKALQSLNHMLQSTNPDCSLIQTKQFLERSLGSPQWIESLEQGELEDIMEGLVEKLDSVPPQDPLTSIQSLIKIAAIRPEYRTDTLANAIFGALLSMSALSDSKKWTPMAEKLFFEAVPLFKEWPKHYLTSCLEILERSHNPVFVAAASDIVVQEAQKDSKAAFEFLTHVSRLLDSLSKPQVNTVAIIDFVHRLSILPMAPAEELSLLILDRLFDTQFSLETKEKLGGLLNELVERRPMAVHVLWNATSNELTGLLGTLFNKGYKASEEQKVLLDFLRPAFSGYIDLTQLGALFNLFSLYEGDSLFLKRIAAGGAITGLSELFCVEAWEELSRFLPREGYEKFIEPILEHITQVISQTASGKRSQSHFIADAIQQGIPCTWNISTPGHLMCMSVQGDRLILQNLGGGFQLTRGKVAEGDNNAFLGKLIFDIKGRRELFTPSFIQGLMYLIDDGEKEASSFANCMKVLYDLPIIGAIGKRGQIRDNCAFTHVSSSLFEDSCLLEAYQWEKENQGMELDDLLIGEDTTAEPFHRNNDQLPEIETFDALNIPIDGRLVPLLDELVETRLARRVYRDYSLGCRVKALRDFANNPRVLTCVQAHLPEDETSSEIAWALSHSFMKNALEALVDMINKRAANRGPFNQEKDWMHAGFNTLMIPTQKGATEASSIMRALLIDKLDLSQALARSLKEMIEALSTQEAGFSGRGEFAR